MSELEENTITEVREELMVSSNNGVTLNLRRKAHFLKPIINPTTQSLPKHPSFPPLFKLNINQFKRMVKFNGRPVPQKNWDTWVDKLQQTHQSSWKKVGIFDAIKSSTYTIMRHNEIIIELAEKWCCETNTFVFPWGECTITLEDVSVLGGFSVLGDCVKTPFLSKEIVEIGNKLFQEFRGPITHQKWMNYFMGIGGELEHMAFLILWLSRYVFSTNNYGRISHNVIPIAICLARGTRISLAPAVLACIYRDLSLLKQRILGFMHEWVTDQLVLWAPFQLVQLWVWERFPTLGPKPISILGGEPRLARWRNLQKPKYECFLMGFKSLGESFVWRPYDFYEFYRDEERSVLINSEVGEELLSFAKCLRSCELVGLDSNELYLPQRVGMQFGLDQDIPTSFPRLDDISIDQMNLYIPPRLFKGEVTARYFEWYRTALRLGNNKAFVLKRQRSLRSHPRGVTLQRLKISDGSMGYNSKSTPISLTSLHDVPIASYSVHREEVEEIHVETTSSCHKSSDPSKNMEAPLCLTSSSNAAVSSSFRTVGEMHTETIIPCNKNTTALSETLVENSECLPCQSPKKAKIKPSENLNVAVNSGFVVSTWQRFIDSMPSCETNNSPNKTHVDNDYDNMASQSLDIVIKKAVSGMDSLMEQVEKCREKYINMSDTRSVDIVALVNIEIIPSHDTRTIHSNDKSCERIPSGSTPIVGKEVQVPESGEDGTTDKSTSCIKTDADTKSTQDAQPRDECKASLPNGLETKNAYCSVADQDDNGKVANENEEMNGSASEPMVIDDDSEDDDNGMSAFMKYFEMAGAKLDARINKLERKVLKEQASKLKDKAK